MVAVLPGVEPVEVCGLPVHPLTLAETVTAAEALIADRGPHQHVVLNAAKVVAAHDDPELARVIRSCSLVNADGQSVVWASRLLHHPVPERVAGIDFMVAMWDSAKRNGYRVYLLGAESDVVQQVARTARARGVNVVGARDGYWSADNEAEVVAAVGATQPDVLFLAIPSPRKEQFLSAHLEHLGAALVVGVGGSFDVIAGRTRRAPVWMQRLGLEWFFRLAQEPRRMFRRYLEGNARFIAMVARYRLHRGPVIDPDAAATYPSDRDVYRS
jgi:N-acetylglucosaminyldiphosphoundecaprenol N-acetyl-beta-D-mannosaminyltransferase